MENKKEIIKSIADHNPGLLFQVKYNPETGFLLDYVCQRIAELFGFTTNQILEDPLRIANLVDHKEKKEISASFQNALKDKRPFSIDLKVDTIYDRRWYQIQVIPFSDDDIFYVFNGVAVDITEQKRKEEELHDAKNLLSKTLDSIDEAVFIIGPSHREIVNTCNSCVEDVFGYRPEELINQTTEKLHLNRKMYEHFATIGEPVLEKNGRFETEYRMKRKDGKIIDTYNTVTVLHKEKGWQGGVVSTVRDITEKKQVEDELKRINTLLNNVYSSLDEAVFVIDPQDRSIISCNEAAVSMFGYAKNEMIGRNVRMLHKSKEMYDLFGNILFTSLRSEGVLRLCFNMRKKNGDIFPTQHTATPIKESNGSISMVVSVIQDITNQKIIIRNIVKHEKELEERQQRLQDLNSALKLMIEQRDKDKKNMEQSFSESIHEQVMPYIHRIKKEGLSSLQKEYIDILESNLQEVISPFMHRISDKLMHLSPSETRVVHYVKQGYSTKDIASALDISPRTVEYHRDNIRKKLGIKNRKTNLKTYLTRLS
jgi:PAS domain S-box-containing protein